MTAGDAFADGAWSQYAGDFLFRSPRVCVASGEIFRRRMPAETPALLGDLIGLYWN